MLTEISFFVALLAETNIIAGIPGVLIKGENPVLSNLVSALVMSQVSMKMDLKTVVTALFVLVGV